MAAVAAMMMEAQHRPSNLPSLRRCRFVWLKLNLSKSNCYLTVRHFGSSLQ